MIILDTHVASELMRRQPDPGVVRWLDLQPARSVWITTGALFESRRGLALLPAGQRREAVAPAFDRLLAIDLEHCVLPFDAEAAVQAAQLAPYRQRKGRPVDVRNTQIAGSASSSITSAAQWVAVRGLGCRTLLLQAAAYTDLMRLSDNERLTIRQTVAAVAGQQARVLLFGSRTDDAAKGGDIDLLVEMPQPVESPVRLGARIGARLQMALGDQRIDVLIGAPNVCEHPIHQLARSTGVPV